jgi:hypothetical protein
LNVNNRCFRLLAFFALPVLATLSELIPQNHEKSALKTFVFKALSKGV